MVSTYYLVKLLQKVNARKRTQYNSKYAVEKCREEKEIQAVTANGAPEIKELFYKCRVCLKEGNIPIFNKNTLSDLSRYLSIFGGIDINEHDEYPKYLCKSCFNSLEAAIDFRRTAKKSQLFLLEGTKKLTKNQNENKNYKAELHTSNISKVPIISSSQENYSHNTEVKTNNLNSYSKYYDDVSLTKDADMYKCKICKRVVKKTSRAQHLIIHIPDSEFAYMCEYCGKTYKKWPVFQTHSLIHRNKLAFNCNLCPYKGRTKAQVARHKVVHTQVHKYMCSLCPRKFLNVSNLNFHLRRHQEPKFRCDTCDKIFYENPKLKRHIESQHMGIKSSFSCNLCSNVYASRKQMLVHQNKVHKRKKVGSRALYHKEEFQEHNNIDNNSNKNDGSDANPEQNVLMEETKK